MTQCKTELTFISFIVNHYEQHYFGYPVRLKVTSRLLRWNFLLLFDNFYIKFCLLLLRFFPQHPSVKAISSYFYIDGAFFSHTVFLLSELLKLTIKRVNSHLKNVFFCVTLNLVSGLNERMTLLKFNFTRNSFMCSLCFLNTLKRVSFHQVRIYIFWEPLAKYISME